MLKVALTGNIGSGKTTVSRIFKIIGIPVFDADSVAKQLYERKEIIDKIIQIFGKNIINNDTQINKSLLANLIFNDNIKLDSLVKIIHPLVKIEFRKWYKTLDSSAKYCIHESAVIFEGNFQEDTDYVILIKAPKHIRFERVKKRNGWDEETIMARESNQWDEDMKTKLSDFIIINDDIRAVLPQILTIHNKLITSN